MAIKTRQLVGRYGVLWARNKDNLHYLHKLGKLSEKLYGVYVLCDGSMPVYIGRGSIAGRIEQHQRSKSRGQAWDHFSWYAIPDRSLETDVEALLLRLLPFYLRSLNKTRSHFVEAHLISENNPKANPIKRPHFAAKRRRRAPLLPRGTASRRAITK